MRLCDKLYNNLAGKSTVFAEKHGQYQLLRLFEIQLPNCMEVYTLAYVDFVGEEYNYVSDGHLILFRSNKKHEELFAYLKCDFTKLPGLFEDYVSKCINLETMDVMSESPGNEEIIRIRDILTSAHPYYKHEINKVLWQRIGSYFNKFLVYKFYSGDNRLSSGVISRDWYMDRINILMSGVLKLPHFYLDSYSLDNFWYEFADWVNISAFTGEENDEETLIHCLPSKPVGFEEDLAVKTEVANMLYCLLDVASPNISKLTLHQRIWLCGNIYNASNGTVSTATRLMSFLPAIRFHEGDMTAESDYAFEMQEKFTPLYRLSNINMAEEGVPAEFEKDLNAAIEMARKQNVTQIYETHRIDNIYQLFFLEIAAMVQNNTKIRICKNCGKYFVVKNRKTLYCDRKYKDGATCSDVGPSLTYKMLVENDEALKMYRRAYNRYHAQKQKNIRDNRISNEEKKTQCENFEKWRNDAKRKREEVNLGILSLEEYEKWLKRTPATNSKSFI